MIYLACIPFGGVELHIVVSDFLLVCSKNFPVLPLVCFQVFSFVFAHALLLEILDVMSMRRENRGAKLETHVKEMDVERTDTVCFLLQRPHTRHNTSPKYSEHKQGENASTRLQANKTHTASKQDPKQPQRNTSVELTHLHITNTSREIVRKPFTCV
jgi:hypothetical protein